MQRCAHVSRLILGPLLFVASVTATTRSEADETPETEKPQRDAVGAAKDATTTFPKGSTISFKPSYTFPNGENRYRAELLVEPILRYEGVLLPDLKVPSVGSVARFRLSALSQQNAKGVAGGLDDLQFVNLALYEIGPLRAGLGFGSVFPSATNPELGKSKWQVGPATGFRVDIARWLDVSTLVQALWSVAGSDQSPNLAYVTVQPFLGLHFGKGVYASSDGIMSFYWAGGRYSVPVNLGLGCALSRWVSAAMVGEYRVAGADQGDVKAQMNLKYHFP